MEISRVDLADRYRDEPDDDLLQLLGEPDLTREVAIAEATSRGLRVRASFVVDPNEGANVPQSQAEDAQRIRSAHDAGDYAIDEDFDVNS